MELKKIIFEYTNGSIAEAIIPQDCYASAFHTPLPTNYLQAFPFGDNRPLGKCESLQSIIIHPKRITTNSIEMVINKAIKENL